MGRSDVVAGTAGWPNTGQSVSRMIAAAIQAGLGISKRFCQNLSSLQGRHRKKKLAGGRKQSFDGSARENPSRDIIEKLSANRSIVCARELGLVH